MPGLQYSTVRGSRCHGYSIPQLEAVTVMVTTVRGSERHGYSIPLLEAVSAMVTIYHS